MKPIVVFLLLIASGAALADSNAPDKLTQLKKELSGVQQEQESVRERSETIKDQRLKAAREEQQQGYQNKMNMEPRQKAEREGTLIFTNPATQAPYTMSPETPVPDYEAVIQAQHEREDHILQYTNDLRSLSARFLELEEQRKALLKKIKELEQHPNQ
jgi:hypothetical protein